MSYITQLAEQGRSRAPNNMDVLLETKEKYVLVALPRSRYMLKCVKYTDELWDVDMINPYNLDVVSVYKDMSTADFETLVFNIWSIKTEEEIELAKKERQVAVYKLLLEKYGQPE
jgi:hypothetical protein